LKLCEQCTLHFHVPSNFGTQGFILGALHLLVQCHAGDKAFEAAHEVFWQVVKGRPGLHFSARDCLDCFGCIVSEVLGVKGLEVKHGQFGVCAEQECCILKEDQPEPQQDSEKLAEGNVCHELRGPSALFQVLLCLLDKWEDLLHEYWWRHCEDHVRQGTGRSEEVEHSHRCCSWGGSSHPGGVH